jgi:methyltransferase-like protein
VAGAIGERPIIAPLACRQAERGEPVTTRRHESYNPGDFEREMLRHLDGTNDLTAILTRVMIAVREGRLTVDRDGSQVMDPSDAEPLVARACDEVLERFARYSLLIDPAVDAG